MNLTLHIKDRFALQGMLPKQGSMLTLIIVNGITQKIRITSEDITRYDISENDKGDIKWDMTKDEGIEVEFNPAEIDLIKKQIEILDKQEALDYNAYDLLIKLK